MLICRDRLSIADITDYWSQEIQPSTSSEELLNFLEAAWWRGQLKTNGPLTPLALLKTMYKSACEGDLTTPVFVTKEDAILPKGIELPDGSLQLDDNDPKPRIVIPSYDPESWTEASCAPTFEALAQKPSRKYYKVRTIQFLMMEIYHHDFVKFLRAHGLDFPKFWRPPISKPVEVENEAHISTSLKPPSEDQSPAVGSAVRPRRRRRPKKFEQAKEAMKRDIQKGQCTVTSLDAMLEKKLVDAFGGFSRDTMRKARTAVLSEIVEDAMWRDIREGRRTADSLGAMSEKELEEAYGVSRDTARKARRAVLSENVEELNRDK